MTSLRQYKENENRIHEQLHDNLCSLMYFYQPSHDFKRVFKKDMFVKNNKSAFYEVVYYLLDILNPVLTKEKLTSWPPYEIRRENKFRSELLQYINELNSIYENADIPHIMPSHLISPGGFKFAKFMLKLSQLVVCEHLRKTKESTLFFCPKSNKNAAITRAIINNIKTGTSKIERHTSDYLEKYKCYLNKLKEQALHLVANLAEMDEKIGDTRKELSITKVEFSKNYSSYPDLDSLKEDMKLLQNEWDSLKNLHDLFSQSHDLLSYLASNNLVLEHNKEDMKLHSSSLCSITNMDQLDLTEMLHSLEILLEQKSLELPNPTPPFIKETAQKVQKLDERFSKLKKELLERKQQTQMVISELQDSIKSVEYLITLPSKITTRMSISDEMLEMSSLNA